MSRPGATGQRLSASIRRAARVARRLDGPMKEGNRAGWAAGPQLDEPSAWQ